MYVLYSLVLVGGTDTISCIQMPCVGYITTSCCTTLTELMQTWAACHCNTHHVQIIIGRILLLLIILCHSLRSYANMLLCYNYSIEVGVGNIAGCVGRFPPWHFGDVNGKQETTATQILYIVVNIIHLHIISLFSVAKIGNKWPSRPRFHRYHGVLHDPACVCPRRFSLHRNFEAIHALDDGRAPRLFSPIAQNFFAMTMNNSNPKMVTAGRRPRIAWR